MVVRWTLHRDGEQETITKRFVQGDAAKMVRRAAVGAQTWLVETQILSR